MMLCLDCGNTRIKWALRDPACTAAGWLAQGALATANAKTLLEALPAELIAANGMLQVVACNVAGESVRTALQFQLPQIHWIEATAELCDVRNRYTEPQRLGADRWAALIGARALHHGSALVICAGTATTVDLLTADGIFLGGLILPGIDLMHRSLARDTAGLDVARGHYQLQPRRTEDAIASGVLHATLGAIERMYRQLDDDAVCIITGGAAAMLLPHLSLPHREVPLLVLEGVAVIGQRTLMPGRRHNPGL